MAKRAVAQGGRAREMRPLVEEWRRGSATQAEVARRHGLNPGTFSWWCARLGGRKKKPPAAAFVAVDVVDVPPPSTTSADRFEVVLSGGVRVRVPASFEAGALRRLLEVVRSC